MAPADWATIINGGNDIAMQWYAITHQTQVPALPSYTSLPGGGRINAPSQGVVLIGLAILAFLLIRK